MTLSLCLVALMGGVASSLTVRISSGTTETHERHKYTIQLNVDFDALSYSGAERVRWINQGEKSSSVIYLHLYPNLRTADQQGAAAQAPGANGLVADEPKLEITEVLDATGSPLTYSLEDQGATLRVNLHEAVSPDEAAELSLRFKGTVPEIDPEETGLATHVVKQVSAAIRSEKEIRRARDINFRCRGVMLLGTAFPVLAVHDGDDWRKKPEATVGDIIFSEAADYVVTITTAAGINVFAPGAEVPANPVNESRTFSASGLRDFAILLGRGVRSEQTEVDGTIITSIFLPEHERVGKRVLAIAGTALRTFNAAFGKLPFKEIKVAEAPLVAGLGSTEFSTFSVIASAFYVDFDSPSMRNLPEIIREQRPAVEESLEFTTAHLTAHQWWGAAVGNDPAREPILDEALSCWSALLYYKSAYGEEKAAAVLDDQVRGVYRLYRTFGGDDMDANRPSHDFRNTFQFAAIITAKGGLMFAELQRLIGQERVFAALRSYYQANLFEIAELDDLRGALIAESAIEQRRMVARTFSRWLSAKRGDEDIAPPDTELANSLGIPNKPPPQKGGDKNAFTAFAKLGKFFWQQMTRIR
ncbi:MAG TPA: M1 family aminopeptidase [Pyrinomonadaceae bacterium]